VAVIGGSGLVGVTLVRRLTGHDHKSLAASRSTGVPPDAGGNRWLSKLHMMDHDVGPELRASVASTELRNDESYGLIVGDRTFNLARLFKEGNSVPKKG
jgi:hypothetical protein